MYKCWTVIDAREKNEGKGTGHGGGEEGVDILERMQGKPRWKATLK